jgi:hypothetical protein
MVNPDGATSWKICTGFVSRISATGVGADNQTVVWPDGIAKLFKLVDLGLVAPVDIGFRSEKNTALSGT